MKRWKASLFYKHDEGLEEVTHEFEELSQLHDLVEQGPAWWTIDHIHTSYIGLVDPQAKTGTVEEANSI